MMKWIKTDKTVNNEMTVITYEAETGKDEYFPGVKIESRKKKIPHAAGNFGYNGASFWEHTTYFVIVDDMDVEEIWTLKAAKTHAETIIEKMRGST